MVSLHFINIIIAFQCVITVQSPFSFIWYSNSGVWTWFCSSSTFYEFFLAVFCKTAKDFFRKVFKKSVDINLNLPVVVLIAVVLWLLLAAATAIVITTLNTDG